MRAAYLAAALTTGLGLTAAASAGVSSAAPYPTTTTAPPTTIPASSTFLGRFHTVTQIASTVPADGDVNPYGVAVVPTSAGRLTAGDALVSNFNSRANVQGTGTTIVEISKNGSVSLFAHITKLPAGQVCPGGIGLTTALGILPGGWVVVGSLPTASGGALPGGDPAGCLIVLNDKGAPVETLTNKNIVGPWDLTLTSNATSAHLFVSNALGGNTETNHGVPVAGNCTIVRLDLTLHSGAAPVLASTTVIGKDFPWQANQAALVLAPTGLALGKGTLYVDNALTNSISAIPDATTRTTAVTQSATTISSGGALDAPLGMLAAPNGDVVVVNGNNGKAVEVTSTGQQVATKTLVANGAGDLFGLIPTTSDNGILFVNDGTNALDLFHS